LNRVAVCGTSGSGKSTLAVRLAAKMACPCYELDAMHHLPGWRERPLDEFRALVGEAASGDRWVIDGSYRKSRDLVFARADTVVWLDYSLPVILRRLIRRTVARARSRELLWGTNRETFWHHLLPWDRSIVWWALKTYRRRRRQADQAMADPSFSHIRFLRFRTPSEAERWLAGL
jgi:adenylate kinase family enzyme